MKSGEGRGGDDF